MCLCVCVLVFHGSGRGVIWIFGCTAVPLSVEFRCFSSGAVLRCVCCNKSAASKKPEQPNSCSCLDCLLTQGGKIRVNYNDFLPAAAAAAAAPLLFRNASTFLTVLWTRVGKPNRPQPVWILWPLTNKQTHGLIDRQLSTQHDNNDFSVLRDDYS